MASDKINGDVDAWSVKGFLQRTSRHNIRDDIVEDQSTPIHVFRVSQEANKENVNSPLPAIQSPTLMEIKDCGKDVFLEMDNLNEKLTKLTQDFTTLHEELEYLRTSKLIVDCMECIHRVGQTLNKKLLKMFGRQLQNVDDAERKFLLAGPFINCKDDKRLCGTYFELLHYYDRTPSAQLDEYLRKAEMKVVQIFQHVNIQPPQIGTIRIMLRNFLSNGRRLRDVECHVAMIKDRAAKEIALGRIEEHGKKTLEKFGLVDLYPMVLAGIHILRNGESCDENDDGVAKHDATNSKQEHGHVMSQPSDTSFTTVKVTFKVSKKVPLLHVVGLLGNLQRLGNSDPEKALHMTCIDGLHWQKVVELPRGVEFMYTFVVLKKTIGQKKWAVVEGPMDSLDAHVDTTSSMFLDAKW